MVCTGTCVCASCVYVCGGLWREEIAEAHRDRRQHRERAHRRNNSAGSSDGALGGSSGGAGVGGAGGLGDIGEGGGGSGGGGGAAEDDYFDFDEEEDLGPDVAVKHDWWSGLNIDDASDNDDDGDAFEAYYVNPDLEDYEGSHAMSREFRDGGRGGSGRGGGSFNSAGSGTFNGVNSMERMERGESGAGTSASKGAARVPCASFLLLNSTVLNLVSHYRYYSCTRVPVVSLSGVCCNLPCVA